ncbi:MAG: zeta toxin family protein [Silvanigrellaceae bacterium]|nr:zeta toxin family protein [Silvanigrellaceae bacterium]
MVLKNSTMQSPYTRPLNDPDCVRDFFTLVLTQSASKKLLLNVVEAECGIKALGEHECTLFGSKYRDSKYQPNAVRWKLRQQIVDELYNQVRLENDNDIKLKIGGALPKTKIQTSKEAIIVIGLPASGKSSISNKIADHYGAIIIDSDFAKRKFPEYHGLDYSASLLHKESDRVLFKYKEEDKPTTFKTLYEKCIEKSHNIVIPKIGYSTAGVVKLTNYLKKAGYTVHLTLVSLDRKKATIRALERFNKTKRYVPLSLIFDQYANDPSLTYFKLKRDNPANIFESFGEISTDIPLGTEPKSLECINNNPSHLF